MRQLGRIFPLFLAASAPAWAQMYFFEAGSWGQIAPPPGKAVIADVTSTIASQTPWGTFTHTETGKYWRSRNGKVRQDTAHGQSTVVDLGSFPRSLAYIDYDLRRIWGEVGRMDLGPPRRDVTGADFQFAGISTKPKRSGRDVLDGFKVTIRKGQILTEGRDQSYEIWTSDDLKIVLLFKLTSGTDEFVQRYHNIRLDEPDPSVFELPSGFRMVKLYPRQSRSMCVRQEVGISGEPRPAEVTYPCTQ